MHWPYSAQTEARLAETSIFQSSIAPVEPGERSRIGTVDNDEGQASDGHAGHDIDGSRSAHVRIPQ